MARLQINAPFVLLGALGNDDSRPYAAQMDADGAIIVAGASTTVDAADVTYSPSTAADWDGGIDPGNQNQANDQLAERVKDIENVYLSSLLPVRATWFHDEDFVVTGNAIVDNNSASQNFQSYFAQTAAANGDVFIHSAVLAPGAYTISLLGFTAASCGRIDIDFKYHSDVSYTNIVNQQDWYTAGTVFNVRKTATFTVVTPGRHIFKFTVDGKHASSSAYNIDLTKIDIYLTAGDS